MDGLYNLFPIKCTECLPVHSTHEIPLNCFVSSLGYKRLIEDNLYFLYKCSEILKN